MRRCFQCSLVVADLKRLGGFVFAAVFLSEVDSADFPVREYLADDDEIFDGNLIEDVHIIFVVFVNDEPNVGAGELKIEGFFLFFFELRLTILIGDDVSKFAIVAFASQFDEYFH